MKKILIFCLLLAVISSACLKKEAGTQEVNSNEIQTIVFYGLFDSEEIWMPMINAFVAENQNTRIEYKKFVDPVAMTDLIINEMAEGEGPDIFMLHNTELMKHRKKLSPAPAGLLDPLLLQNTIVDVAARDLIYQNENEEFEILGMPLYVDTLALYYNDAYFEESLPSSGKPSNTWAGIAKDVTALNRSDQSFERFERSGIALGRADNISRAFDVLMLMFMQHKVDIGDSNTILKIGGDKNAIAALDLYTSFAKPSQAHYSWNETLANPLSAEKELETFAKGKVAMIFGYSYTYDDIVRTISRLKAEGETVIDISDIKTAETPQLFNPSNSAEARLAYADYFIPVVSRNAENPELAWKFLASTLSENNVKAYNAATKKPSSLRSLISEQMQDPIYGVFSAQLGYAESISMADAVLYKSAFLSAVQSVIDNKGSAAALNALENEL